MEDPGDKITTTIVDTEMRLVKDDSPREEQRNSHHSPKEGELAHLSKRQRKKLLKKEQWLATKTIRKQKQKEKLKLKKQALAMTGDTEGLIRRRLKHTMSESNCQQRIAIDMSFDEYMSDRDLAKTIKQIHWCYSSNRKETNPAQFYVTSFTGKCVEAMEKSQGYQNWDLNFKEENYVDLFPRENLVYLSSDSENVIQELDTSKVYVIGGLVDHNSQKGLCHRLATEKNIAHGRLPIDEYLTMKSRKVLTILHVFQILLAVSHGKSWKEAFISVIPARKGAVELEENNDNVESDDLTNKNNLVLVGNGDSHLSTNLG